jgi:hypothetical protein
MKRTFAALVATLGLLSTAAQAAYMGSAPLVVANGGTGLATITAHYTLVGAGTSAIAMVAPSATAGVPFVSGGSSADPSFTTAVVAGGGTGVATLAANGVVVGEGTAAVHVVGTSSTADAVVAWAAAGSDPAALSVNNCTTALTYSTSSHAFGCNGSTGLIPTLATATGTSPIAITATNELTTVISMGTPGASVINLPTAVQTAGWRECVKDGTTNFGTNNATVKSPTSGTIDGVAGATGVVMNQAHQEMCFISDGTNWFIE